MIVLSYAPEDTSRVEKFYRTFEEAGLGPWMDSEDRPPGTLWERALSVAMRRCELLIFFLSEHSVDRHGLLQKELIQALNDWEKKETDDAYVVLVRLEACKIPKQLARFQKFEALDYHKTPDLVRLLRVLNGKASSKLDFLPANLGYKLIQISPESSTRCDTGVTIPWFHRDVRDTLDPVNNLIEAIARDILETFIDGAEPLLSPQEIRELGLEKFPNDGFWLQPTILTATHLLLSIEFYISTYRRGEANRRHYTRTLNIDVVNYSEIFFTDVVNDPASAIKFFSIYCHNALMADPVFRLAQRDWQFDLSGSSLLQSFGFRNADMIFIFAPRQLGDHSLGRKVVEVPFNDVYRLLTNRTIDLLVGRG
jgi:TIR domain